MRLRVGAMMPVKGGRPAIVCSEIFERASPDGSRSYDYVVGRVERVIPFSVEAASARVLAIIAAWTAQGRQACVFTDVNTPQGTVLYSHLRASLPDSVHRPHGFRGRADRADLFGAFLGPYSAGRVRFVPGMDFRADLDRSLVFFGGTGVRADGVELASEDEALVAAVGLSMQHPGHGPDARAYDPSGLASQAPAAKETK